MAKSNMIALVAIAFALSVENALAEYTDDCIAFSSTSSFTLKTANISKNWDGTLWTSTDMTNWSEWNGAEVSALQRGDVYNLYVRGDTDSTVITGDFSCRWELIGGAGIACAGNLETLRGATGNNPSPTKMARDCYYQLFRGCTLLTTAPTLPATVLSTGCYHGMFAGCTSLTDAPALPATTLATSCYCVMFSGCTSLTTAPTLPALIMTAECYYQMFYGCTSLADVPALPATKLAASCYASMFAGCTSLVVNTTAPGREWKISANDASAFYWGLNMFARTGGTLQGEPSLDMTYYIASIPTYTDDCITFSSEFEFTLNAEEARWNGILWTSTDKTNWTEWHGGIVEAKQIGGRGPYYLYVRGNKGNTVIAGEWSKRWCLTGTTWIYCSGNIETLRGASGNANAPTTKEDYCYAHLFSGCTLLRSAPTLPAKGLSNYCYSNMFRGTSLTEAPELPATNLGEYCYYFMFGECGSLTNAPALPATMLARGCYGAMFYRCMALTDAPALPATTMAVACYENMFWDCTSLTNAPALPAPTLKSCCYSRMFNGCTSLTDVPALPATTLAAWCYDQMFYGCSSLEVNALGPGREWTIQATATVEGWGTEMFSGTSGTLQGEPKLNTVYYVAGVPLPDGGPYKEDIEEVEWTFGVRDGAACVGYGWQYPAISDSVSGSIEIPNQLGKRDVVSLAVGAFFKKSNLTGVSIPSTVTNLEEASFEHCSGLVDISLPDGLLSIGDFVFHGCENIETLTVPDSVMSIGESAFQGCVKLVFSKLPQHLTSIGAYAFKACGGFEQLTVPSRVERIGQNAFLDCNSLHSVDFECAPPEGVTAAAIKADAIIRYNSQYESEWLPVIVACGWTNAKPYTPGKPNLSESEIQDWVVSDLGVRFAKSGELPEQYQARFEAKFGKNYTAAFDMETGKVGLDNQPLCVWQDYVAGTDPLDLTSKFKASITFDDTGTPIVEWDPDLNDDGVLAIRKYTTYGCENIGGDWHDMSTVPEGDKLNYRFFKVTVGMP